MDAHEPIGIDRWQPFQITFKHEGRAGEVKLFEHRCESLFRVEDVIAEDSARAFGTKIADVFVGSHAQMTGEILTRFYVPTALRDPEDWTTAQVGQIITMRVKFLRDCTFDATLTGKAIL